MTVLGSRGGYPLPGEPCSGYLRRMDPWSLDAVWISHRHPDHWTDLPIALHRMAVTVV